MLPFSTRFFCWLSLSFGAAGGGYFLTLIFGWPFLFAIVLAVGATAALGWWLLRDPGSLGRHRGAFFAALILGASLLLYRSLGLLEKHGGWDAWGLWNYHARMLADPHQWSNLFQPLLYDHPDYPLCLPAGLAFLMRAFPGAAWDSPGVVVAFASMFAVVFMLFGELFRRRAWVGIAALFFLTQDDVFLRIAVSQYADTLLALYLLTAVVALGYVATDARAGVIAGAAVGLCLWTKNEGFVLGVLAVLCYAPTLLRRRTGGLFLIGLAFPLTWWLVFRVGYAPQNDLSGQGLQKIVEWLGQSSRYAQVWEEVSLIVRKQYGLLSWLVVLFAGILLSGRERPDRGFVLVLLAAFTYCLIFLVSPYEPEWHVRTALPRLLHQLQPTLLFACGVLAAKYRFLAAEQLQG